MLKNSFLTFFLFGFCLFLGQFSTRKRVRAQNTTKPKCHAGITLPSLKLCSRVAVVISKYVHEWETLLPSNVIDFVMLSAQMVLMFSQLPGEAYFPRVTSMSRRQGVNQCAKINAKV